MGILTTLQEVLADQQITSQEVVLVVLGAFMAFNVWATANLPQYTRMKTYVAAAITVLGALYTFIIGGVSTTEAINLVVLFLSAIGVAITPQPVTRTINGKTVLPDGSVA